LSPGYLGSRWCMGELEEFCRLAEENGGLSVGDRYRLFEVLKTHFDGAHPQQFGGQSGYKFYEFDKATGAPREFSQESGPVRDRRYWEKLEDLAWELRQLIVAAKPDDVIPAGNVGNPFSDLSKALRVNVYLAETTDDLVDVRDRLYRELRHQGYMVLPDRQVPYRQPTYGNAVLDYLGRSALSIHLVGATYGIIPENEQRSIIRVQLDAARDLSTHGQLARVLWLPESLTPVETRQAQFIEELKKSSDLQGGAELLQTSIEELKNVVLSKLRFEIAKPDNTNIARRRKIYLILNASDVDDVSPLNEYLNTKGYEVLLPILDGAPATDAQSLDVHGSNMRESDGLLIYYGNASQSWFEYYYRELQKLPAQVRAGQPAATLVYVARPETPHKRLLNTPSHLLVKNLHDFAPGELDVFLHGVDDRE
jgi:hypothetical protein